MDEKLFIVKTLQVEKSTISKNKHISLGFELA